MEVFSCILIALSCSTPEQVIRILTGVTHEHAVQEEASCY